MKIISHDLPKFTELEIYPLADVHIGDPLLDKKRLQLRIPYWEIENIEKIIDTQLALL